MSNSSSSSSNQQDQQPSEMSKLQYSVANLTNIVFEMHRLIIKDHEMLRVLAQIHREQSVTRVDSTDAFSLTDLQCFFRDSFPTAMQRAVTADYFGLSEYR